MAAQCKSDLCQVRCRAKLKASKPLRRLKRRRNRRNRNNMAEESGALVVADDAADAYPCVRYMRSLYTVPKEKMKVKIRSACKVTYDDLLGMYSQKGGTVSRSPEKWAPFVNARSYGLVEVGNGTYPIVCFDVESFPEMKNFAHFVPLEVATKVFPELYKRCLADPDGNGIKLNSGTDEARERARQRLDGLKWTPADCGGEKPAQPNPQANGWLLVPKDKKPAWCLKKAELLEASTSRNPTKTGATKRKLLPDGFELVDDPILAKAKVAYHLACPLAGASWKTDVVGDSLIVTVHTPEKGEAAEEVEGEELPEE